MAMSHWFPGAREESESMAFFMTFLVMALTVYLALYLILWKRMSKEGGEARLPPGPRGLPLLGYLPFLSPDLHRCFAELASTHGPVMRVHLGAKLCVVLSSPAAVKEALKDHDVIFANHDVPTVAPLCTYGGNDIVWTPYGPVWRMLRKVTVRELLSPATMESLYALRRREVRRLVDEVRGRVGEPVAVRQLVYTTALNAMTTMLWGGTVGIEEGALGREFREVTDALVEVLSKPNVSDFFPALAWLDLQGLARRMRRISAWLDRILDPIIEHRLRTVEGGGEEHEGAATKSSRDFLQVMVELLQKQKGDPEAPLTIEHLKALFMDLVLAGTDTTSTTVEWAMTELLCNPQKMMKAKEEIAAAVGEDATVEESHLPKLHYLGAVVKEVLRLHPVVPLLIPYRPTSTCTVAGYKIPKGAKVFINAWAIHRDPKFWEDASKFEPERFLGASQKLDYTGNSFYYIPFGAGRRICAGVSLGERMVMFILASLLHSFDWALPGGMTLDLSETFGIVMKKEKALVAVPALR